MSPQRMRENRETRSMEASEASCAPGIEAILQMDEPSFATVSLGAKGGQHETELIRSKVVKLPAISSDAFQVPACCTELQCVALVNAIRYDPMLSDALSKDTPKDHTDLRRACNWMKMSPRVPLPGLAPVEHEYEVEFPFGSSTTLVSRHTQGICSSRITLHLHGRSLF